MPQFPVTRVNDVAVWVGLLVALLAAPHDAAAATCTWTGGGTDNNWSTAANWDNCGGAHATPQNGDSLVFPAGASRNALVNDLPGLSVGSVHVTGVPATGLSYTFTGQRIRLTPGTLQFSVPRDSNGNLPIFDLPLTLAAPTLIANVGTAPVLVNTIDLNGFGLTLSASTESLTIYGPISGAGSIAKVGPRALDLRGPNTYTGPTLILAGSLGASGPSPFGRATAGVTVVTGASLHLDNGQVNNPLTLAGGLLRVQDFGVDWRGHVTVTANTAISVLGSAGLAFTGGISGDASLVKSGTGSFAVIGASPAFTGQLSAVQGGLSVAGDLPNATVIGAGEYLAASGTIGPLTVLSGGVDPLSVTSIANELRTADVTFHTGTRLSFPGVALGTADARHFQIRATGTVTLGNATLLTVATFPAAPGTARTIIENDGSDPVVGTFAGLPEGATLTLGGLPFVISYRGGTGNDVTLTDVPKQYFLSEGATGPFFDEDIVIANSNPFATPVSLTFLRPGGSPIVQARTLAPRSRTTIPVDEIPGLEAAEVSAVVTSQLPLAVERTMFWDATRYAGHTGSAVGQPSRDWLFAEGAQGFFHTYLQLANANTRLVDVTLTFLRDAGAPVLRTVTVAPLARLTVDASAIGELANSSFGITIHASEPIIAERAMYFGSTPTQAFSGGHASAGVTAPAPSWLFAEGATGDFFDTFLLLSNPQNAPASVTLKFLLETGETITTTKTIPANARLTVNVEGEGDARLRHAAFSTVVTSDAPIVAERSMYWIGEDGIWTEGHNSFGAVSAGLVWGLAEGRLGGPRDFHTYIQLGNPQTTDAVVRVTFLRETDVFIERIYTVRANSRLTIDVNGVTATMRDEFVGARVEVLNAVPLVVERSMYWRDGGALFRGGTNATGVKF